MALSEESERHRPATEPEVVELALYDRIGKRRGLPLWKLLDLPEPRAMVSSFTIAIDEPEASIRIVPSASDRTNSMSSSSAWARNRAISSSAGT